MKLPDFRKRLAPPLIGLLSSPAVLLARRGYFETRRRAGRRGHEILFFHDLSNPYSYLLAGALPDLVAAYNVTLTQFLVVPPDPESTPEAALLSVYAACDAARIAPFHGINFRIEEMERERQNASESNLAEQLQEGSAQLARLGHYQGGMLYYAGEWYWGVDRLAYLEERLRALGTAKDPAQPVRFPRPEDMSKKSAPSGKGQRVEMFFSFRSPYSYLALEKLTAFQERTDVDLRLRPVMPMVTRGVPLSREKRHYIWFDSTREARRQEIAFGKVADPLSGRGYENALALFPLAEAQGKALDFSCAVMRAAFAEGRYLSDEKTLRRIAEIIGLAWSACRKALENEGWRAATEENAAALRGMGLWGVPSFRCGELCLWGQDRLWLLERLICEEKNNIASS